LQLSVYTMKGNDFMEVVADPNIGTIAKAEKITDADDLKDAAAQKAAMAKATVSLLDAADTARHTGGQRLSAAAKRACRSRSDPAAGDGFQEGNREARLKGRGDPTA
jgi:hypothetical protein